MGVEEGLTIAAGASAALIELLGARRFPSALLHHVSVGVGGVLGILVAPTEGTKGQGCLRGGHNLEAHDGDGQGTENGPPVPSGFRMHPLGGARFQPRAPGCPRRDASASRRAPPPHPDWTRNRRHRVHRFIFDATIHPNRENQSTISRWVGGKRGCIFAPVRVKQWRWRCRR